jgi:hypothetical protein
VRRLRTLARHLPGEDVAVLEVRLARGRATVDAPVDLSLRVLEPGGPFVGVSSIWLEYDLDREPRPIVCARLPADAQPSWVVDSILPALHGRPLAEAQRRLVRLCHEAIPPSGSLLYVFSLLPRGTDAVRMEIFGLNPVEIVEYLGAVAPDADPRVAEVAPIFAGVERVHLSFDLGSTVLPRIGIEGSFARLPNREPRWADLLERLVLRGLCLPAKRDALLSWNGSDTFWTAPQAWPVDTAGVEGFCVRSLSHVKVVCDPGRELEAKAYLMFGPWPSGEGRSERQRQLARELLAAGNVARDFQLLEPAAGLPELPRRLLGMPSPVNDDRQVQHRAPLLVGGANLHEGLEGPPEPGF